MASPDLGKMVGPLPLGAWVAVVGGGLAFMAYQRKQSDVVPSDSMAEPTTGTGTYSTVGDGSVGGWVSTDPPATNVGPTQITTNDEWGTAAINWLISQGYDPAVSDSAIRKYLDQESGYSAQEYALITFALAHLGATPTPLPAPIFGKPVGGGPVKNPPPVTKPPVKKPPVKGGTHKPKARYYTVRPGDSLASIGRKFHVSWQSIYNANKSKIKNPNVIHAGTRLLIPN